MIEAQTVKERISLKDLFENDGHKLRRAGSAWVCSSPFNATDKTPSCYVHEDEGFYKCFSSGAGGDCFTYWQTTRGVAFNDALMALANIAGLTKGELGALLPAKPKPEPIPELAPRLEGEQLEKWLKSVERLREDEDARATIAQWRGFDVSTITWAVEHALMGRLPYLGAWRESFVVERPDNEGRLVIGFHVRLAPYTSRNDTDKSSWRFVPKGIGSWPFVIGQTATAKSIFPVEGQWDALALIDAMGWAEKMPEHIAIVGMRGASSWKRFVRFYSWPEDVTFFAISDADQAGREWFAKDGFVASLRPRSKRVVGFWPGYDGMKDFNDVWKARAITRDELLKFFREKMQHVKEKPPMGPTFLQFIRHRKVGTDPIGEAARAVWTYRTKCPGGRKPFREWQRFWERFLPPECHEPLRALWNEWKGAVA